MKGTSQRLKVVSDTIHYSCKEVMTKLRVRKKIPSWTIGQSQILLPDISLEKKKIKFYQIEYN